MLTGVQIIGKHFDNFVKSIIPIRTIATYSSLQNIIALLNIQMRHSLDIMFSLVYTEDLKAHLLTREQLSDFDCYVMVNIHQKDKYQTFVDRSNLYTTLSLDRLDDIRQI